MPTVVILAVNNGDVLCARGGKWMNLYAKQKIEDLREDQKDEAIRRFRAIATELGRNVKFTPPVWKKDPNRWSTRFVGAPNPIGFVKGTFPDSEHPGETPVQAAQREFAEETGYALPVERFEELSKYIFLVQVDNTERDAILQAWTAMGNMGELVSLEWRRIGALVTRDFNTPSQEALPHLAVYHSMRMSSMRHSPSGGRLSKR